ncbi:MAG: ATP-dependent Clp protease proteolytic subunit [Synergistaceae bacterium]|nr:ATP-dependent Clp protease proteolytic subunit [Synergistaceae bacterium]
MKKTIIFGLILQLVFTLTAIAWGAGSEDVRPAVGTKVTTVYFAPMTGIVGVPMEEYVDSVFDKIGVGDVVLVFRMNTPGGLVDSMSHIMSRIGESDIPVVVWVAPSGARAASAGAFIVQAAHIAAMAPETNIGASHPVTGSGQDIGNREMDRKVVNDLLAKMRSFANARGRNAGVAESMVRDSVSLTATEAFEQYVIDVIASDERELISKIDGRTIRIKGVERVLSLDSVEIKNLEMDLRFRALEVFSRPDIAYIALIAGIILIVLEIKAPGGFVMGTTGVILLLIAAYGLRVLPVNFAGVFLLIGGIVIILADFVMGGIGILAVPGIIAMLFGGFLMFRTPEGAFLNVSAGFIFGVTFVMGLTTFIVLRLIYKAFRKKTTSGMEGLVGARARVIQKSEDGVIMAMVHGEYWRISCDEAYGPLSPGDEVEILEAAAMTLLVRPVKRVETDTGD